jgi:hypothetical protein
MKPAKNLLYLGLGYNKLNDDSIANLHNLFPNLVCLDVSNNYLEDVEFVLNSISKFKRLKMFCAYGNPICCLPNYKKGFIHALIDLEYFDNKKVTTEDRLNNNAADNAGKQ